MPADDKAQAARDALLDSIAQSAKEQHHAPSLRDLAEAYALVLDAKSPRTGKSRATSF